MATDKSQSWKTSYQHWLGFQQSLVRRMSNYFQSVGDLVASGSIEPREWIEMYADLWSGAIGDIGDWMQQESRGTLRPNEQWVQRCRGDIQLNSRRLTIPIDVPLEAFGGRNEITLVTGGLIRAGKGVVLEPGRFMAFRPPSVQRSNRRTHLELFDFPGVATLRRGDIYSGLVWARETKLPVAAIEVHVTWS